MDNSIGLAYNPEPPEPVVVGICATCGYEIYEGTPYAFDGISLIHADENDNSDICINDLFASRPMSERLEMFKYRTVRG